MKIVFLVNGYYPTYSTNGICVKKIIDSMPSDIEIEIISCKGDLQEKNTEIYEHTKIIRILTRNLATRYKLSMKKTLVYRGLLYLKRVQGVAKANFNKVNYDYELENEYFQALKQIDNIDIAVPCCFPLESIGAATKIKYINPKIKVCPLLFDKFSDSVSHHRGYKNMKRKFLRHLSLEKKMFRHVDHIIATNDWKNYFEKYYDFNSAFIDYIEIPALPGHIFDNLYESKGYYPLVYAGVLDRNIRPIEPVLKILSELLQLSQVYQYWFLVRGNCEEQINNFCKENPNRVTSVGAQPLEVAYQYMQKAYGLLSIGNTDVSQTPSKLFEYVCMNKPMIHFYHDINDRVVQLCQKNKYALCINLKENPEVAANRINSFLNDSKNIEEYSYEEIKDMYYEANPIFAAKKIIEQAGGYH